MTLSIFPATQRRRKEIGKDLEVNGIIAALYWKDCGKPRKICQNSPGVPADICTVHMPNTAHV